MAVMCPRCEAERHTARLRALPNRDIWECLRCKWRFDGWYVRQELETIHVSKPRYRSIWGGKKPK